VSWLVSLALLVLGAVGVGVIASLPNPQPEMKPPEPIPVNVEIQRVRPLDELPDAFTVTAVIEPQAVVRVAAEVAGRVERYGTHEQTMQWRGREFTKGTPVDEGHLVAASDPIVHLNKDLLQARYERAAAQFDYDQREYRRLLDLYERGTTSKTELDDAATQRDISKAAMEEATRELERTTIRAPLDGVLNRLLVEPGEYVMPGTLVAELVDLRRVKVVVDVPERDVPFLKIGQSAEILLGPPENRQLVGTITYIGELADDETRTTRTEITVDNADYELRSGQIVRARITRRVLHDVMMIPLSSVIPLEKGRVVYVVDDQMRARRRNVELGLIKGRDVQVLSGLVPGDRLIVKGHRYVGPGQPVAIQDSAAAPGTDLPLSPDPEVDDRP